MARRNFKADPNDLVILLMGLTGTGKSHFLSTLTGNTETRNGHNLRPDTQNVTPYIILHNGIRLVLVDTPGFDNGGRPDTEILRSIASWLTQTYPGGDVLRTAGVIYFHRITDKHVSSPALKNIQMFSRLCGGVHLSRARLVTTMWDTAKDRAAAERRESELKHDFWQELLKEGAVTKRFDNTRESAWGIVEDLLGLGKSGDGLLLVEELVEQQKRLSETEAAKVLYSRLQQLLAEQKKTLKELADEAKLQSDAVLAKSLQGEYDKVDAQLQATFEEMRESKMPLPSRIVTWFLGRKPRAQTAEIRLD